MFPDTGVLAEDTAYQWLARSLAVAAPHVSLMDLVRFDERLEAHVAALALACRDADVARVVADLPPERHSSEFIALSLAARLKTGLEALLSAQGASRGGLGALAWADRIVAVPLMQRLLASSHKDDRTIGIAVAGMRRLDPGAVLASLVSAPSAALRARAYRSVGQLGRADLMAQLRPGLTDGDPECRFWSAWSAARMGSGEEALNVLADIAWSNFPRADRALDLLLRRFDVSQANAWLREFATLPDRQRALIRATGVIGDPLYVPWLIERMSTLETARLAGEAFSMITGLDLAYRDLDRKPPADFESGPNDDPADENIALDEDEYLPWPDPEKIGQWWAANRGRFDIGTPYFLGTPKPAANWLEALSDAYQRQRHAAALEIAIRQPEKAMFEVRARGRLQRQLIARARGLT